MVERAVSEQLAVNKKMQNIILIFLTLFFLNLLQIPGIQIATYIQELFKKRLRLFFMMKKHIITQKNLRKLKPWISGLTRLRGMLKYPRRRAYKQKNRLTRLASYALSELCLTALQALRGRKTFAVTVC
jgi:hypothetical protein